MKINEIIQEGIWDDIKTKSQTAAQNIQTNYNAGKNTLGKVPATYQSKVGSAANLAGQQVGQLKAKAQPTIQNIQTNYQAGLQGLSKIPQRDPATGQMRPAGVVGSTAQYAGKKVGQAQRAATSTMATAKNVQDIRQQQLQARAQQAGLSDKEYKWAQRGQFAKDIAGAINKYGGGSSFYTSATKPSKPNQHPITIKTQVGNQIVDVESDNMKDFYLGGKKLNPADANDALIIQSVAKQLAGQA